MKEYINNQLPLSYAYSVVTSTLNHLQHMEWSVYKMSKELNPDILHSNYLELFFKQSQDAISVFDMNNNIITCNPAFEKLYGWTLQECVGKSISFYAPSEHLKVDKRRKLLFKGQCHRS